MNESLDPDSLVQKHLDGQTSADEAEALSAMIVADAEVRTLYLKAAQLHAALADEVLALDLSDELAPPGLPAEEKKTRLPFAWPQQLVAALVAGVFVGLVGFGVVSAMNSPRLETSFLPVADASFESMSGPVSIGFPTQFGRWSGDPAEVVEDASGNRQLRFLKTANVMGNPGGGASACNVFQLVDLTSLQQRWGTQNSDDQFTLELSARFRREAAPTDADLPKSRISVTLQLYRAEPESIGVDWPEVIREAVAVGNKAHRLAPGETSTVSSSCVLDPEANLALISVNANAGGGIKTPTELGGYFVDDVELKLTRSPKLPVRFVK